MTSTRPPRATGGSVTKARAPTSREKDQKQPGIAARREKISSAGSLKGDLGDKGVLNTAQSSNSRRNSAPSAGAKSAAKSKLTKVDGVGTQKLIQKEWRSKKGGDLLSKLNRCCSKRIPRANANLQVCGGHRGASSGTSAWRWRAATAFS